MLAETMIILAITCLASAAVTVLVYKTTRRLGVVDKPDNHRKSHVDPVPLGGGLALFMVMATALVALLILPGPFRSALWDEWPELVSLLLAGAVIVTVGLTDDRIGLRGHKKLLGQILAASILMAGGLLIREVGIFHWHIALGPLAVPLTLLWLLGAVNALNLLDGIDGLAATMGLILAATVGAMALLSGRVEVAIVALVFAGCLLGFLPFNLPSARIFLGDAGSMLIGLVVGTLAIEGSLKGPGTVLLAAPLAVWTIPMFDTAAAILRRKLTGRSIYAADRGHLHHRLLHRLGSNFKVLGLLAATCAITSTAALVSVFLKNDLIALVTCGAVVTIFILTGLFGRIELFMLGSRLRRIGVSFLPEVLYRRIRNSRATFRLQGSQHWDRLLQPLTEAAEELGLSRVDLDVNLPAVHESYHATWEQHSEDHFERCWQIEVPLLVADQPIGRLTVLGERNGGLASQEINQVLDLLERFETQMLDLVEQQTRVPAAAARPGAGGADDSQTGPAMSRKHPK